MTISSTFIYDAAYSNGICLSQTVMNAPLILNGQLVTPQPPSVAVLYNQNSCICLPQAVNGGSLILNGSIVTNGVASFGSVSRSVRISSLGGDLSATTFVIYGTLNGQSKSYTTMGPASLQGVDTANNSVYFDTVTSVTVSATVANAQVEVGAGILVRPQPSGTASFGDFYRSVSITAGATSLAGISFTVTGTYLGTLVTSTIRGPAANATVDTSAATVPGIFETVTSVVPSASVTNGMVQVGSGFKGFVKWWRVDDKVPFSGLGIGVLVPPGATLEYSFIHTTFEVSGINSISPFIPGVEVGVPYPNVANNTSSFILKMQSAENTDYAYLMSPTRYCTILIEEGAGTFSGSNNMQICFIQQGVRA